MNRVTENVAEDFNSSSENAMALFVMDQHLNLKNVILTLVSGKNGSRLEHVPNNLAEDFRSSTENAMALFVMDSQPSMKLA